MSLRGKFGFGNLEPLQFLQGRCVLAQEMGERDPKTQQPSKWKCTSECKLPTADDKQRIVDLKETVRTLRQRLDSVDSGCQNGHYTCKATGRDLAGHPLTCTVAGCDSKFSTALSHAAKLSHNIVRSYLLPQAHCHH